jgi:RNA polymerase sigma-70 factor (ECF subfamily)
LTGFYVALTTIDRNLLQRCLADEPGAWRDFVDRFISLFVHVIHHTANVRSVPLSQHDVDDLCAEVFLVLLANDYRVLRQFRGNSSLATYLTVVARRIVVREVDRRRKAEALGHVAAHHTSGSSGGTAVADSQLRVDDREEVQSLLKELPPSDAEVVRQFHLEGKSYREISTELGIPENSIGPLLTRAREKLRVRGV